VTLKAPLAHAPDGAAEVSGEAGWVVRNVARHVRLDAELSLRVWSRAAAKRHAMKTAAYWGAGLWVALPAALLVLSGAAFDPGNAAWSDSKSMWLVLAGLPAAATIVVGPLLWLAYRSSALHLPERELTLEVNALGLHQVRGQVRSVTAWSEVCLEDARFWVHPRLGRGIVEELTLRMEGQGHRDPPLVLSRPMAPAAGAFLAAIVGHLHSQGRLRAPEQAAPSS
jgi:hypothetical protein